MSPVWETFANASIRGWRTVGGKVVYFIANIVTTATSSYPNALTPAPDGSLFIGTQDANTPYATSITKLNSDLSVAWTKGQTNSTGSTGQFNIDIDVSGNITTSRFPLNTNTGASVVRLNSSGIYVWDSTIASPVAQSFALVSTATSGNVYVLPYANYNTSGAHWYVYKYNSSGTIQWQRSLAPFTYNDCYYGAVAPVSENVYSGALLSSAGTNMTAAVAKWNSAGTLQWVVRITGLTGLYKSIYSFAIDSNENTFHLDGAGSTTTYLTKLDSTGAQSWQRSITLTNLQSQVNGALATDPSGNVYVSVSISTGQMLVLKYNSSGTLQWQRTMYSATANFSGTYSLKADANSVYFIGNAGASTYSSFVFKLPADGSLTGSYILGSNTWTWAASAATDAAGSYPYSTYSISDTAGSATISNNGALTQNTYTYTTTTKVIP